MSHHYGDVLRRINPLLEREWEVKLTHTYSVFGLDEKNEIDKNKREII